MNSADEAFLAYWSENRERQRTSPRPLLIGMSFGFVIGIAILLLLSSGWYERANMEANSKLSSFVLLLAIMAISFFLAFFYRKFRWEMMEQRFKELEARKTRAETTSGKQL
jgi:hypothetical protein